MQRRLEGELVELSRDSNWGDQAHPFSHEKDNEHLYWSRIRVLPWCRPWSAMVKSGSVKKQGFGRWV